MLAPKWEKWREVGENCIMRSFIKLYSSHNIIRMIKLRRMRCVDQVACRGGMRNAYRILVRGLKGSDHLEDQGIDRMITLKWIFTFGESRKKQESDHVKMPVVIICDNTIFCGITYCLMKGAVNEVAKEAECIGVITDL
jgi:hypothetical protein